MIHLAAPTARKELAEVVSYKKPPKQNKKTQISLSAAHVTYIGTNYSFSIY